MRSSATPGSRPGKAAQATIRRPQATIPPTSRQPLAILRRPYGAPTATLWLPYGVPTAPPKPGKAGLAGKSAAGGVARWIIHRLRRRGAGWSPAQDPANHQDSGDSDAGPAEPVAVLVVEGRGTLFARGEQGDLGGQEAGAIDGAAVVAKDLAQAAVGVHPAGEAVVGAADEGEAVFDGAEQGGGGVLPLGGTFAEPAVVGEVDQEIGVVVSGFAGGAGERCPRSRSRARSSRRVWSGRRGPGGRRG